MTLASAFATGWTIANLDTLEELAGDFEAQDVVRDLETSYVEHFALTRENPITQFAHGGVDHLSFTGRFFADPAILSLTGLPFAGPVPFLPSPVQAPGNRYSLRPSQKLAKLEAWMSVDVELQRPPLVLFTVGNGELSQTSFIEALANVKYDRPLLTGEVRGVTFTIRLRKFVPFSMELSSLPAPESRYHHTKTGEYYELIAQREYGLPLIGDIIRKRNPDKDILETGDVVKLPSIGAIQTIPVVTNSIPLQGLSANLASPQRTLRQAVTDRLNKSKYSTIVPEGL